MVIDALINGLPIRLLHAIYPVIFGLIYAIFSYLYFKFVDVHPIYPVLDWANPLQALIASLLTITFAIVMQVRTREFTPTC